MNTSSSVKQEPLQTHLQDTVVSLRQFRDANNDDHPAVTFSRSQQVFIMLYDMMSKSPFLVDPDQIKVKQLDGMPFEIEVDPCVKKVDAEQAIRSLGFLVDWLLSTRKTIMMTSVSQWIKERQRRKNDPFYSKQLLTFLDQLIFVPENANIDTSSKIDAFVPMEPEPETTPSSSSAPKAVAGKLLLKKKALARSKPRTVLVFVLVGVALLMTGFSIGAHMPQNDTNQVNHRVMTLKNRIQQMERAQWSWQEERDGFVQQLNSHQRQKQKWDSTKAAYHRELAVLKNALQTERKRVAHLENFKRAAREEMRAWEVDAQNMVADHMNQLNAHSQQYAQLQKEKVHVEQQYAGLAQQVQSLKAANVRQQQQQQKGKRVVQQLKRAEERLAKFQRALDETSSRLSQAREQIAALSQRNSQLERAETEYPQMLHQVKSTLQEFVDDLFDHNWIRTKIDCSKSAVRLITETVEEQLRQSFEQMRQASRDIRQDYDACVRELYQQLSRNR